MSKDSFIIHTRHGKLIEDLDNEQRGILLTAIFAHAGGEEDISFDDKLIKMAFSVISEQMDYDRGEYEKKCKRNAENAKKRWHGSTAASERIREDTAPCLSDSYSDSYTDTDSDTDSCSYSENNSDTASQKRESGTRTHAGDTGSGNFSENGGNRHSSANEAVGTVQKMGAGEASGETGLTEGNTGLAHSQSKEASKKEYLQPLRGRYENVRLTAFDEASLKLEFPDDLEARIERLSEYIATHGDKYCNHAAVIRSWAKNGRDIPKKKPPEAPTWQAEQVYDASKDENLNNEYFQAALARSRRYLEEIEKEEAAKKAAEAAVPVV